MSGPVIVRPGAAVAFWRDGTMAIGILMAEVGARVRVVLARGKIEKVQAGRILFEVSAPARIPEGTDGEREAGERVMAIEQRVRERSTEVEIGVVWEIARLEPDRVDGFDSGELAELALGSTAGDERAAMVLALLDDGLHFVRRGDVWHPRTPESVEEMLTAREVRRVRERERQGFHEALASLGKTGEWISSGTELEQRAIEALEEVAIHQRDASDPAKKLALEALAAWGVPGDQPHDAAFRLLRGTGHFADEDMNLEVLREELDADFPPDVLSLADESVARGYDAGARTDRREVEAFSIDSAETREIDDLLAIEEHGDGWTVDVFIADPGAFIQPGDVVDVCARSRTLTRYMPDVKILMLPPAVSERGASLVVGEDRPAVQFRIDLDRSGEVVDYTIAQVTVRSRRRLDYFEVDKVLAAGDPEDEGALFTLDAMAAARQSMRIGNGAIMIDAPEVEVSVIDGRPSVRRIEPGSRSRRVVAEAMILVGEVAARFCSERDIPALYRRQTAPDLRSLGSQVIAGPVAIRRARRAMKRAEVGLRPGPHAALGLPAYVQATSPLRRYADLVLLRQIVASLSGDEPIYDNPALREVGGIAERAEGRARRSERTTRDYWVLRQLESRLGEEVEGVIVEEGPRPIVQLPETLWVQPVPDAVGIPEGETVVFQIERVNPRAGLLVLRGARATR